MTWGEYDGLGTHYSACMNVRGQLCGVAFLLPLSRGLWLELGSPVLSVTIAFIHQASPFSGPLFKELTV